jgi:hypothetical protein
MCSSAVACFHVHHTIIISIMHGAFQPPLVDQPKQGSDCKLYLPSNGLLGLLVIGAVHGRSAFFFSFNLVPRVN